MPRHICTTKVGWQSLKAKCSHNNTVNFNVKEKSGFEQVQRQKKRYRSQGSCKNEGHEGQTEVDKSNRQVQKSHTVQTMSLFHVICMQEEFTPKVANNHTEWAQSHQTMCPAQAQDYHCAYQEQRQLLKPAKHYTLAKPTRCTKWSASQQTSCHVSPHKCQPAAPYQEANVMTNVRLEIQNSNVQHMPPLFLGVRMCN